jgi:hypothetical protein
LRIINFLHRMHSSFRFFFTLTFLVLFRVLQAQNFNYSLAKDSLAYQPFTTATVIAGQEDWANEKFSLQLPFQFNCAGVITDSLTIESNRFISFGKNKRLALVAFNNFINNIDTTQTFVSTIAYVFSGTAGNRIAKIEFKNLSISQFSDTDYFSYQLWLYENGNKIEFHIGPNAYASPTLVFPELVGLINRMMNTTEVAYLATGNPSSPTGTLISGSIDLLYINNVPSQGITYTFIPLF